MWWNMVEKFIRVRFDFGWLAGHTSEAPKIRKISCTISFWLTNKIHPLCVLFSKKRRKQPCEKKLFKRTVWFGLSKSVWLFVCLFVCFQAISRANAWLPHLGVEPSRVVRVTQQLPSSPPAAQLPSGVSLRMWTQSRCPRTGGWIFAHEKVGQLEVKD